MHIFVNPTEHTAPCGRRAGGAPLLSGKEIRSKAEMSPAISMSPDRIILQTNTGIFQYCNIEISRYPNIRISKYLNIPIGIYSNIYISEYLNMHISPYTILRCSKMNAEERRSRQSDMHIS